MINALLLTAAAAVSSFQSVKVHDFHDGDTFRVDLPRTADVFGKRVSVRIRGIDSPEIKDERACARRDAALAKETLSKFLKAQRVDLNRCKRDKYFRIVCDVNVYGSETADAAAHMLAKGLAQPYDGREKTPWTCLKK